MKIDRIKTNLLALLLLLVAAGTVNAAQWKLTVPATGVIPGKPLELQLQVEGNSTSFCSFQVDLILPEGLLLASGKASLGDLASGHTLSWKDLGNNRYRYVAYSTSNTDMTDVNGTVLNIPVTVAADFKGGNVQVIDGILANSHSEKQSLNDYSITLKTNVLKKEITINPESLEYVLDPNEEATQTPVELTCSTLPEELVLTINYFTDDKCTVPTTEDDRKKEGVIYAKVVFAGNDTLNACTKIYPLSITSKKLLGEDAITAPNASGLVEGQLLATSLLTGGSATDDNLPVPGAFVWTDGNQTVSAPGGDYSVTFIPKNSMAYATKTLKVKVDVKRTFLLTASATDGGTVSIVGKTANDKYVEGQTVKLVATPYPNYTFTKWSSGETTDTLQATVNKDISHIASFTPIEHSVTINQTGAGTVSIVTDDGTNVTSGTSCQQGTNLQIVAIPADGYQLETLKAGDKPLVGDTWKLIAPLTIHATFTQIPVETYKVTVPKAENGSVLVYASDGSPVASGSYLEKGAQIRIITLPAPGYEQTDLTVTGASLSDDVYSLTGEMTATATFNPKTYKVNSQAIGTAGNPITSSLTLTPTGDVAYGTTVRMTINETENQALVKILANGREVDRNEELIVTGNLQVTAIFNQRVDIEEKYIRWPYQKYYYNGVQRTFVPFATQTYAGYSFEVSYQKGTEVTASALNAGEYDVLLHRDADPLYNEFNATFEKGLIIEQSPVAVIQAPADNSAGSAKTRPQQVEGWGQKEDVYGDNTLIKYNLRPKTDQDKNNYYAINYYHPGPNATKTKLNVGQNVLRSTSEPQGYVRVTNGGLPYDATNGAVEVANGTEILIEAVPTVGYAFKQWADGNTQNPRTYTVSAIASRAGGEEGTLDFTPVFDGKPKREIRLVASTSPYTGSEQTVALSGDVEEASAYDISFFADEACEHPATMKDAGSYYVKVYMAEDEEYKEYSEKFPFEITKAKPLVEEWPEASPIVAGNTLATSELLGGNAGAVAGSFVWLTPDAEINEAGNQAVSFIPSDLNYEAVTNETVAVSVVKSTGIEEPDEEDPITPPTPPEEGDGDEGEEGDDSENNGSGDEGDEDTGEEGNDPSEPEEPTDPEPPTDPDNPTGIESIDDVMKVSSAQQAVLICPKQSLRIMVIALNGQVIYQGKITENTLIPMGQPGIYVVKCSAEGKTLVKKIAVY